MVVIFSFNQFSFNYLGNYENINSTPSKSERGSDIADRGGIMLFLFLGYFPIDLYNIA